MCVCVWICSGSLVWQQSIWRLKGVRGKLSITCRILFCPPNYTVYVGMQKITIWVSEEKKVLNFMLLLEMFLDNNRLLADQPDRCYTINNISLHSWQFNLIYCRRMLVCACASQITITKKKAATLWFPIHSSSFSSPPPLSLVDYFFI